MLYDSFRSNKKINNILNSEQFQYSEQIMEIRIKLNLTIKDIAKILNITEEYYLDLEYSSLKIPVDEYKNILGKLLDFEKNKLILRKRIAY